MKIFKVIVLLFVLTVLFVSCAKDKPLKQACWEVNTWDGLMDDASLFTDKESSIPAVDQTITDWLKKEENHITIRSIESENFDDLRCLKEYIGNRSLVQLGESSHGTKEYSQMKVRLIKFLHEEMGFDVIAFESNIFNCYYTNTHMDEYTPEEALLNSIFSVWATEETTELFEYIKSTRATEKPLIFAGFDSQYSGDLLKRPRLLQEILNAFDTQYATVIRTFDTNINQYIRLELEYMMEDVDKYISRYNDLISYLDQRKTDIIDKLAGGSNDYNLLIQSLYSTQAWIIQVEQDYYNNKNISVMIKDSATAQNVKFLKEELYPDKKIILWAHNDLVNENYLYSTSLESTKNMGTWLNEFYPEELYTIGFYMLRGQTNSNFREAIDVVLPTESNSLEAILYQGRTKYMFTDILNHPKVPGNQWMYKPISVKSWGNKDYTITLNKCYDGVVLVDNSTLPDYID